MSNNSSDKYDFLPLMVHFIATEERASPAEIVRYVERTIGEKVASNAVFSSVSKLVEYSVIKLNEDTTATFSLRDWNLD